MEHLDLFSNCIGTEYYFCKHDIENDKYTCTRQIGDHRLFGPYTTYLIRDHGTLVEVAKYYPKLLCKYQISRKTGIPAEKINVR